MWLLSWIRRTNGGVSSHVIAVVETDKGQVGHVRSKGQDEQDAHHARHPGSPQAQRSDEERDGQNRRGSDVTAMCFTLLVLVF